MMGKKPPETGKISSVKIKYKKCHQILDVEISLKTGKLHWQLKGSPKSK